VENWIIKKNWFHPSSKITVAGTAYNSRRKSLLILVSNTLRQNMIKVEGYFRWFAMTPNADVWNW